MSWRHSGSVSKPADILAREALIPDTGFGPKRSLLAYDSSDGRGRLWTAGVKALLRLEAAHRADCA